MTELVAVPLEHGGVIVVEMDHAQAGMVKAGRPGQIVGQTAQSLQAALESVTRSSRSSPSCARCDRRDHRGVRVDAHRRSWGGRYQDRERVLPEGHAALRTKR